jgi:hypothetical protein
LEGSGVAAGFTTFIILFPLLLLLASPIEPKARKFLEDEMQKFFFGEGSEAPPDYKPS